MSVPTGPTTRMGAAGSDDPYGRFPSNRVVAFAGPYVAILSGAAAAWLGRNLPGLEVERQTIATDIASAIQFAIGAGVTWALHHKWLDGHQRWEAAVLAVGGHAQPAPGPRPAPAPAPPPAWWDVAPDEARQPAAEHEPERSEPVEGQVVDEPVEGPDTGPDAPRPEGGFDREAASGVVSDPAEAPGRGFDLGAAFEPDPHDTFDPSGDVLVPEPPRRVEPVIEDPFAPPTR